jgi:hypothetical protein
MTEVAVLGKLACAIAVVLPLMAGTTQAKVICGANTGVCIGQDGNSHDFGFRFRSLGPFSTRSGCTNCHNLTVRVSG